MAGGARPKAGEPPDDVLAFDIPDPLLAHEPPEARGIARDAVRLMVSEAARDTIHHARARDLPDFLAPGDLLVVNTSATINAALEGWRPGTEGAPDEMILVHLSSPVPHGDDDRRWVIELRRLADGGTRPLLDARPGERVRLRGGGAAMLVAPFGGPGRAVLPNKDRDAWRGVATSTSTRLRKSDIRAAVPGVRLWVAELECPSGVLAFAAEHGNPIRYSYVPDRWPLAAYQTIFASEPGSAEMPSAGRPFTHEMVERLRTKGVAIAPIVLHTGVASLESGEAPYPERFRVPVGTADAVMETRERGGRVVAVGTTAVRALETAATPHGRVRGSEGWTDLVIAPERGVRVIDAILTGFHEPRASHLAMLEAIAGRRHLEIAYCAALREGYLWHEFGDVHLIVRAGAASLDRQAVP